MNEHTDPTNIDTIVQEIIDARKNPLLVLYYHEYAGQMQNYDIKEVYEEFRRNNWDKTQPKKHLDVIIHTNGGVPLVGYMLAQTIHDFTKTVDFLIPEHSYSAGTLLCLSADNIIMGDHALMSPIDIVLESVRKTGIKTTELVSIDYFMKFVKDCKEQIERMLDEHDLEGGSSVDSALLVELVKEVGALDVGKFYRLRQYSEQYALKLLQDYMFKDKLDNKHLAETICKKLLYEFPSHSFVMDYHICHDLGLPVYEMERSLFDSTRNLIKELQRLTKSNTICKNVNANYKVPFFKLYDYADTEPERNV